MSYSDPVEHKSMALDTVRNAYYQKALSSVLTPDSVVVDAGAGIGVLGLMAAKLGAGRVYLIEPATGLEAARQLAVANGLQDRVEFIESTVESAQIPGKADVITSVFTGNFLLEEDLLPSLLIARDRFLKPGGALIPGQGRMMIAPVSIADYYRHQIDVWCDGGLVDQSLMRQFAANHLYYGDFAEQTHRQLAAPAMLNLIDFYTASEASCRSDATFSASNAGELHGFLGWFDIDFGHAWLSTSPQSKKTHWSQVFLPIPEPIAISAGDIVSIHLDRPQFGEWSWRVTAGGKHYKQSTFLGAPITPAKLKLAAEGHRPVLNRRGELIAFTLEAMRGDLSNQEIADKVFAQFAELFADLDAVRRFVIDQARSYSR